MGYRETARQFEISDDKRVAVWERIYLEEGPKGFAIERQGLSSEGRPPKQLPKEVEEDLLAEVQRLRAELEYLKTCKPWFWKTSDASAKNAGSSKAEAQTRTQHSFINRSTAACDLLLSFETDAESGQIRICEGRDHGNLS